MTKTAALALTLFAAALPIGAQTRGPSSAPPVEGASGKKIVMVGCIYPQGDKFLLFSYKQSGGVELQSADDLKAHVGHKVKVHGTMLHEGPAAGASKVERNADDTVKQESHVVSHEPENGPLRVSKITMLAQTCDKRYRESAEKQLGKLNP